MLNSLAAFVVVGLCASASYAQSNGATYVYDELDRLIQVIATNGSSTQYTYDAAGNISAVKSDSVTTLAITSFYPGSGNTGTAVTVYGSGFSTTATSNTVTFNGVAATVSAATTTQLTVTVPATATTGLIVVTNANGSVTSTQSFTVGSLVAKPTVTSFTPTVGLAGTVVTVTGTNFQTGAGNTDVYFDSAIGSTTTVTSTTQATSTVTTLAQSGKIAVRTANGIGTSSADFYIVPSGVSASSVVSTARIVPNGAAASLNISSAGKNGMLIFDGVVGQQLSLGLSALTPSPNSTPSMAISIFNPSGVIEDQCTLSAVGSCNFIPLLQSGNYRIVVTIDGSHTAISTFLLSSPITGTITPNAASATIFSTTRIGQTGLYTFAGTAGQNLTLDLSDSTFASAYSYAIVYAPNGSQVAATSIYANEVLSNSVALIDLPQTGTYTISIVSTPGTTGQVAMQLFNNAINTTTRLMVNGTTAITQSSGITGAYSFTGSIGQQLNLAFTNVTTSPSTAGWSVSLIGPTGVSLGVTCSANVVAGIVTTCKLPTLPSAGVYTVQVYPYYWDGPVAGLTATVGLWTPVAGTLTANATTLTTFSSSIVGQNGSYTFAGTAGQNYMLNLSDTTLVGNSSTVYVYGPGGNQLGMASVSAGAEPSSSILLPNLAQTGTYTVSIVPFPGATGQVAMQLTNAAVNSPTQLTVNGTTNIAQTLGVTGLYSFTGAVGQQLSLAFSNVATTPSTSGWSVSLIGPNGVAIGLSCSGVVVSGAVTTCQFPQLAIAGIYTVQVWTGNTSSNVTGLTATVGLWSPVAGSLTANALTPTMFTTATVGQNGIYTFSATAGQSYLLSLSDTTFVGNYTTVYVYAPNGSQVGSANVAPVYQPATSIALNNLTQSGTYTVSVVPFSGATGQIAMQLSNIAVNATSQLTLNGTINIAQSSGVTGLYSFNGTVGQQLNLAFTNVATSPSGGIWYVSLVSPAGVSTYVSCDNNQGVTNGAIVMCQLPQFMATGLYTIQVFSGSNATGLTATLGLWSPVSGTLTANASTPTVFSTNNIGQNGTYTFTGTAGQNYTLNFSGTTFIGQYTNVSVVGPNGLQVGSTYFASIVPASSITLSNLAQSGIYTVYIVPFAGSTGQLSMQLLNAEVNAPSQLTINGTTNITQTSGLTGSYSFTGAVGQQLNLAFTNVTTTPSNASWSAYLVSPTGVIIYLNCFGNQGITTGLTTTCAMPQFTVAGVYTIQIQASYSASGLTATLGLWSPVAGTLVANAPATTFATTHVGQNASYQFAGTAGQNFTLNLSGTTFAGSSTNVFVYAPNGTQLGTTTVAAGTSPAGSITLLNLAQSGTYIVSVLPYPGSTGQTLLQLVSNGTTTTTPVTSNGTLTINGAPLSATQAAGVSANYTFTGSIGQWLDLGFYNIVTSGTYSVTLTGPTGATLGITCSSSLSSGAVVTCRLPQLAAAGTYAVNVAPTAGSSTLSMSIATTSETSIPLVVNAVPTTFAPTQVGQNGRYTFTTTAGSNFDLEYSGATFVGYTSIIYVYAPDGSLQYESLFYTGNPAGVTPLHDIPQDGTYSIVVVPLAGSVTGSTTGQVNIQLLNVSSESNPLTLGTPIVVTQAASGAAEFTFAGTVGQSIDIGFSNITANGSFYATALSASGTAPAISCSGSLITGGAMICQVTKLTANGLYTVVLSPESTSATLSVTVTLNSESGIPLVANAAPTVFAPTMSGQNGRYTFTGTVGSIYNLVWSGTTFAGEFSSINVYEPNGTLLANAPLDSVIYPSGVITLANLQQSGTYSVQVVPLAGSVGSTSTGQVNIQLLNVSAETSNLAVGGSASVNVAAGKVGEYSFTGSVGQWLDLGFSNITTSGTYTVSVLNANGAYPVVTCQGSWTANGTMTCRLSQLTATGLYTIVLTPGTGTPTLSSTITLTSESSTALTANAAPIVFAPTLVGQNGRYTFTGTAGQVDFISWSATTFAGSSSNIYVYAPNGSVLTSAQIDSVYAPSGVLGLPGLPQTGTYTVLLVPLAGSTGQVDLQLLNVASETSGLTIGTPISITQTAGLSGEYTFTGSVGQWIDLGFSNITTGGSYRVTVLGANGSVFGSTCSGNLTSGAIVTCRLPQFFAAGMYTIVVAPINGAPTLSATMVLSSESNTTLTANAAPTIFAPTVVGQNGRYTFTATAGSNYDLTWDGATLGGASSNMYVYAPDGSQLTAAAVGSLDSSYGLVSLSNLSQSGVYTVLIVPTAGSVGPSGTGEVPFALLQPSKATVTYTGTPLAINLSSASPWWFTVSGTAGAYFNVTVTGMSTTSMLPFDAVDPQGNIILYSNIDMAYGNNVPYLTQTSHGLGLTGTHTILIFPTTGTNVTGTLSITQFNTSP